MADSAEHNNNNGNFRLRYMTERDLRQVNEIDTHSFSMPWSPLVYHYELTHNHRAHMGVISHSPRTRWSLFRSATDGVVALGGLWFQGQEAHISTIATHPKFRGNGLGELMLVGLIGKSIALKAGYVVLEVRISNKVAQNLYRKYEFVIAKRQIGYYHDNGEDAYLMVIRPLDDGYRQRFAERTRLLATRFHFLDSFSDLKLHRMSA
jgi:ribosomal-protein-alanine N-acetyltransferase